jgi:hypothetical protein
LAALPLIPSDQLTPHLGPVEDRVRRVLEPLEPQRQVFEVFEVVLDRLAPQLRPRPLEPADGHLPLDRAAYGSGVEPGVGDDWVCQAPASEVRSIDEAAAASATSGVPQAPLPSSRQLVFGSS